MSSLTTVNPAALGSPRGYSNGILGPAGARPLAIAGQIAWDETQHVASAGFVAQFGQALANVLSVVREAGGGPEHLAQLTIYVTDKNEYLAHLGEIGRAYRALAGKHFPAMALVEVKGLLEPAAKVEIQALAFLPPA